MLQEIYPNTSNTRPQDEDQQNMEVVNGNPIANQVLNQVRIVEDGTHGSEVQGLEIDMDNNQFSPSQFLNPL